jgi:uncharacterized damage-inducible protein DinB
MHYDYTAIPDSEVPFGVEPAFRHAITTYASEVNKTVSMWRAVPDELLGFKPHEKTNSIRTILVHQLLSERRFFAEFAGLEEPPVEELLPPGDNPTVQAYIDQYVLLARKRLPQFAEGTMVWWLEPRRFFGGQERERIWIFWRRVLHTCHHRTQVQTWLRLAGQRVPAIYGPSGDVKWDDCDPTYSLEAARRGAG